jgi:hypothetical protein
MNNECKNWPYKFFLKKNIGFHHFLGKQKSLTWIVTRNNMPSYDSTLVSKILKTLNKTIK